MRMRRLVTLLLPLALLATAAVAVWGRSVAVTQTPPDAPKLIDAPTNWVAFAADYSMGSPGKRPVLGRFFRWSDGSSRLETGPPGDQARVVFIKHIAQGVYFSRRVGDNGQPYWISGPMSLPPGGWKPKQMTEEPGRRMVLPEKVEGFSVVQMTSTDRVTLFAPDLNFFQLVSRRVTDGYAEIYSNVRIGEPDASLLTPPDGDEIRRTDKPGGIVSGTFDHAAEKK